MEISAPYEQPVFNESEEEAHAARESTTPESNESSKPDCDKENFIEWCLTSFADYQTSLNLIKQTHRGSGCKSVLPIKKFAFGGG